MVVRATQIGDIVFNEKERIQLEFEHAPFYYIQLCYSLVCHKIDASESHSGSGFGSKSE